MKKIQPTTQYRKDFKRIKNNSEKVALLKEILLRRISVLLAERSNALQKI